MDVTIRLRRGCVAEEKRSMYLAPITRSCSLPCLYVAGGSINSKSRHSRPPIGRRGMRVPASEEGRRTEDIYIGDTPGKGYSVEGYKGRFIRDDPQKYPSKVNYGMLKGLAGGWAGGEVGLKERDLPSWAEVPKPIQPDDNANSGATHDSLEKFVDCDGTELPQGAKNSLIYIGDTPGKGYSVEGYKGRFIRDDPLKYPSKVNYGMLKGLAGGWAGGEVGLKERDLPEWAVDVVDDRLGAALSKGSGIISSFAYAPPALMPGMDVLINDIGSQYHNFRGILQRITDGRAAVLFEGGNWDKLVTFKISQLDPIISEL